MTLTKDAIFAVQDLKTEIVKVPEWGGEVIVRMLTGTERDALEAEMLEAAGDVQKRYRNFRARFLARCLVDEAGNLLFSAEDIDRLGGKSFKILDRIYEVAQRLNAVANQDVEALVKNS